MAKAAQKGARVLGTLFLVVAFVVSADLARTVAESPNDYACLDAPEYQTDTSCGCRKAVLSLGSFFCGKSVITAFECTWTSEVFCSPISPEPCDGEFENFCLDDQCSVDCIEIEIRCAGNQSKRCV